MTSPKPFDDLKARLAEIHDLTKAGSLLGWDQQVMMPRGGAAVRAEQLATLGRLAHERFVDPEIGRLLDALEGFEAGLPYDSDEASLIRVARDDYRKARRVPAALREEMARVSSLARDAWAAARAEGNFSAFLPYLQQTIDLKFRYIDCFDEFSTPYDALLDDYERGTTAAEAAELFEALKQALVPLLAAIEPRAGSVSDSCLSGRFPVEAQREFCHTIVRSLGFGNEEWRLDATAHPFASSSCTRDIRITTRYYEDFLSPAVFGTFHECGHGLYENGVSPTLERTPLARGASLGLHESQSRLWENLVGRSRAAWRHFMPLLRKQFPGAFDGVEVETFYRAINKVQRTLIRVEADELTYGLHIILRFELEQEMLARTIPLDELPEAWNARVKQYLGIDVPHAAHGILQDVHWSLGLVGYFPTYTIGSIVSAQIWERVRADIPDLEEQFEKGEFRPLRAWLRERMHVHGRKFTPRETLKRVVGTDAIDAGPYVRYLRTKYTDIYEVGKQEV